MAVRWLSVLSLFISLNSVSQEHNFSIEWRNREARAISTQSILNTFSVRLQGKDQKIIGNLIKTNQGTSFVPAFAFSNGVTYEVFSGNEVIYTFTPEYSSNPPKLLEVYPQTDTLPENFLKFYLVFDQPMGVGKAYDQIHLYQGKKLIRNAFLKLEPELWDSEKKTLTVCLTFFSKS